MIDLDRPPLHPESLEELANYLYRVIDEINYALNSITDTSENEEKLNDWENNNWG